MLNSHLFLFINFVIFEHKKFRDYTDQSFLSAKFFFLKYSIHAISKFMAPLPRCILFGSPLFLYLSQSNFRIPAVPINLSIWNAINITIQTKVDRSEPDVLRNGCFWFCFYFIFFFLFGLIRSLAKSGKLSTRCYHAPGIIDISLSRLKIIQTVTTL